MPVVLRELVMVALVQWSPAGCLAICLALTQVFDSRRALHNCSRFAHPAEANCGLDSLRPLSGDVGERGRERDRETER